MLPEYQNRRPKKTKYLTTTEKLKNNFRASVVQMALIPRIKMYMNCFLLLLGLKS